MSMLLPTDFFASAPSMRFAPRCSVQSPRSDSMDIDDVASLLFGGGHDPLEAVIPRLSARVVDVAELHHARRAAALLERRRQEQVWALRQQQQRQRQREAELRQAYAVRQAALERERQHQLAAYVAALVEHQQQLALEEEQARREAAQRARLAEMQKQRALQQAQRQKALQRQAQLAYEREIMAMLEAQQQQQGEQQQRQPAALATSLEDALLSVLGPLAQLFAVEQPQDKGNDAATTAAKDKEPLKPTVAAPESEPMEVDIVEAAVNALKADARERVEAQVQAAPEVVAAPTVESVEPAAPVATAPIDDAPEAASEEQLLYSYNVPAPKDFDAASLNLAVDTKQRKVTVSGLWSSPASTIARSSSPTPSAHSHTSGSSKRSHSRRRSRVADVDENGEEIIKPDEEEEDGFVDVGPGANDKHSITIDLPQDADTESVRAYLDDEGLKLYYKQVNNSLDLD